MLDANCRVCVACRMPVEPPAEPPAEPPRHGEESISSLPSAEEEPSLSTVPFPWGLFVLFALANLGIGHIFEVFEGGARIVINFGFYGVMALWVHTDADRKNLPNPVRWACGTFFLGGLVFPWYLARRMHPDKICPFVEGNLKNFVRVLVYVNLFVILFIGLIISLAVDSSS